tara:strand:- start:464 stop:769 length:306 start_codon:yes stop_codon:yes gene_type:complete
MNSEEIYDRFQRTIGIKRDDLIAKKLGITKQSLSGFKQRGSLPFEALMEYCEKHGIDANHILFGHDPGEKINEQLKIENERLKAKLEIVRELLVEAIGREK